MDISILFEDNDCIVLNKPPGIVVNRAESVKGLTVQDWVMKYTGITLPDRENIKKFHIATEIPISTETDFLNRAGIVHRIDKETSGVLLVAKNFPSFLTLQEQFKQRIVKKTYLALVHGLLVPNEGQINAPIGRLPWNRERFGVVPGGKESLTRYTVTKQFHHKNLGPLTQVTVYPETGRTHQIRVHFKYINFPLVGDYLYAGRKTSRDDRIWAPRVMLHAWKATFRHPKTEVEILIEAPIPDDISRILQEAR